MDRKNAYNMRLTTKEREESMATRKTLDGKPYAGNPHVRFDEGEVAPAARPGDGSPHGGHGRAMRMAKAVAFGVCALLASRAVVAGTIW